MMYGEEPYIEDGTMGDSYGRWRLRNACNRGLLRRGVAFLWRCLR